jgi:hypothetical protein
MSKRELGTNRFKPAHGHWRMTVKDLVSGEEETTSKKLPKDSFSIEAATDDLTKHWRFVEYEKSYAYYKDGDTEYIRFVGTVAEIHLQLTIDVWTCYCEPLNENQDPPF